MGSSHFQGSHAHISQDFRGSKHTQLSSTFGRTRNSLAQHPGCNRNEHLRRARNPCILADRGLAAKFASYPAQGVAASLNERQE